MKKFLILFFLSISTYGIQAQSIDSVKVQYNSSSQILSARVFGRIIIFDPEAIVNISDSVQNDSVTIDIDFWPCSPWQTQVLYDTLVEINLNGIISAGIKTLRVRTFVIADLDTICYYRSSDRKVDSVFVSFNIPMGLFEQNIEKINIYPNPTNGVFFVELQSAKKTEYSVYSSTGQLMQHDKLPENGQIDIS